MDSFMPNNVHPLTPHVKNVNTTYKRDSSIHPVSIRGKLHVDDTSIHTRYCVSSYENVHT
jgi:hypothetical protein